ncbi:MAG: Ger(x)C family spore germination protein [Paenibacillus sp.]|uniref:Ger(x)C family spore germination protein n=1 Tax=Paenibacillus sp. TaxID=58172 RepID=UPI0029138463|nr:Ger(x)C family spore germination protein [Paenibacillus sp.]MDU4694636.1 Ger(x)C family spore germination protein [Paenibacillus sp.]
MKLTLKVSSIIFLMCSITGCWTLNEPDHLAFNLGDGWDIEENGHILVTTQIAIPANSGGLDAGGGAKGNRAFLTMSASGTSLYDSLHHLQNELSREMFVGHREVLLIGQKMAEHGIDNLLDEIVRNPKSELRSKVFVVKDGRAKDIFTSDPIFDSFTQTSLTRQEEILHIRHTYFRDLLADSLSRGIHPLVPAIGLSPSSKPHYVGSAIFNNNNHLKLVGFLDSQESAYANWITNRQDSFVYIFSIREKENNLSVILNFLKSQIRAQMSGDDIQIHIQLTGKGTIVENNTDLDPTKAADLQIIEKELQKTIKQEVMNLVAMVQEKYRTDIFRFGEKVHHQLPKQWKVHQEHWERIFPELQISMSINVRCDDPGQANRSMKY